MIRRSFFQTLAAALLPQPVIAATRTMQPGCKPPARALRNPAPIQNPEWLQEWREIPNLEIFAKDLPCRDDPHQRDLGEVLLRHIGEGPPLTFRYTGGSEPGAPHRAAHLAVCPRFPSKQDALRGSQGIGIPAPPRSTSSAGARPAKPPAPSGSTGWRWCRRPHGLATSVANQP